MVYLLQIYFDLEYKVAEHPSINGEQMLENFKNFLRLDLQASFSPDRVDLIDLESSTPEKFSHHLVVNMFNAEGCPVILEDNRQVGLYVSELVRKIQQKTTLVTSSDNLLLSNNQVFVDQAVYSKNRNFRTFLSSKFGKTAVLKNATKEKANYDEKKFCLV